MNIYSVNMKDNMMMIISKQIIEHKFVDFI